MRRVQTVAAQKRSAMTLIELIVVIAILGVIAALTVVLIPAMRTHQKSSQGAEDLQGYLFQAKIMALRDKEPRGLRLYRDPNNPSRLWMSSVQFIEQPAPWFPSGIPLPNGGRRKSTIFHPGGGSTTWFVADGDMNAGLDLADKAQWPVRAGDYLFVGNPPKVMGVIADLNQTSITIAQAGPALPQQPTAEWHVIRRPRPIAGEEIIALPEGVVVDFEPLSPMIPRSLPILSSPPPSYFDILFAPGGNVMGDAGRDGQVVLWVRDASRDQSNPGDPGEQSLIVVYTKTGHIGSFPVDTTSGGDPHSLRKDAKFRPSGM